MDDFSTGGGGGGTGEARPGSCILSVRNLPRKELKKRDGKPETEYRLAELWWEGEGALPLLGHLGGQALSGRILVQCT